jgi:hypothetical protein
MYSETELASTWRDASVLILSIVLHLETKLLAIRVVHWRLGFSKMLHKAKELDIDFEAPKVRGGPAKIARKSIGGTHGKKNYVFELEG